jgi:hypothetical protein
LFLGPVCPLTKQKRLDVAFLCVLSDFFFGAYDFQTGCAKMKRSDFVRHLRTVWATLAFPDVPWGNMHEPALHNASLLRIFPAFFLLIDSGSNKAALQGSPSFPPRRAGFCRAESMAARQRCKKNHQPAGCQPKTPPVSPRIFSKKNPTHEFHKKGGLPKETAFLLIATLLSAPL